MRRNNEFERLIILVFHLTLLNIHLFCEKERMDIILTTNNEIHQNVKIHIKN